MFNADILKLLSDLKENESVEISITKQNGNYVTVVKPKNPPTDSEKLDQIIKILQGMGLNISLLKLQTTPVTNPYTPKNPWRINPNDGLPEPIHPFNPKWPIENPPTYPDGGKNPWTHPTITD